MLLSSHSLSIFPVIAPSPHAVVHTSGDDEEPPAQKSPVSTVQLLEHPSPLSKLSSSHPDDPCLTPSPQSSEHVVAGLLLTLFDQLKLLSMAHAILHPSLDI